MNCFSALSSLISSMRRFWPLALIPALSLAFMVVCYVLQQPLWERAFRSDDSPVSWLSSALLFANGVLALTLSLTPSMPARLGRVMSAGLLWCALDEQFMFHERFKYDYVATWFPTEGGPAAWLGDMPMVVVGLGGVVCVAWFLQRMWRNNALACILMLAALAVGITTLAVDWCGENWWLAPFEEGIEVLAESIFLSALLATLQVQSRSS